MGKLTRSAAAVAVAAMLGACSSLTPFTTIDGTDASKLTLMNGHWTVMNLNGTEKTDGLNPPAVIEFDTASRSVSGFDGCNNFKGTYSFEGGLLKAKVAGTRSACGSELARTVSSRINDLLTNGATVFDTSIRGARILTLKNAGGDVRMAPTSLLQKK